MNDQEQYTGGSANYIPGQPAKMTWQGFEINSDDTHTLIWNPNSQPTPPQLIKVYLGRYTYSYRVVSGAWDTSRFKFEGKLELVSIEKNSLKYRVKMWFRQKRGNH